MPPRNRKLTEQRILEAARNLLRESGFENWGVNSIARRAGVDKVLLYRYFASLEGLLEAIVQSTAFWPDPDTLPDDSPQAFIGATIDHLLQTQESSSLLSHPPATAPASLIRRRFNKDLQSWREGLIRRTTGTIGPGPFEIIPALLYFQATTGRERLSPYEIWRTVSPPLHWESRRPEPQFEKLPVELL